MIFADLVGSTALSARLDPEDMRDVIRGYQDTCAGVIARLGGGHLPTETNDAIIARTDGVPLLVEELTKAILETGAVTIPASLYDSLMARLDGFPERSGRDRVRSLPQQFPKP